MREMKDSGVEWIGEIPITWKCCKQKYEVTLLNGRAYKDNEFEEDGKYPILRVGNLFSNPVWYSSSLELPQDKYCNSGDLLYSWSMSYSPIIWEGPKVIYHYHIWKTILSDSVYKKFVYYYMKALTDALKAEIHETTMGFITMGVMNNSYFAFPTKSEQRSIANYLDQKCSEIDAITNDIQAQIDTLEQYKRSVITEAVTKGLDPDVEMKDSGIEWIGKIPNTWELLKAKYCVNITNGSDPKTDGNIPVYGSGATSFKSCGEYKDGPAVLIGRKGATLHIPHYVENRYWNVDTAFDVKAKQGFSLRYYYYLAVVFDYGYYLSQTTLPSMTQSNYNSMKIPFPPSECQDKIVCYIDNKCKSINAIITEKQSQLSILSDYKKSLIYEYVTGKKEVPVE